MRDSHFHAMRAGDTALLRATLLPRGDRGNAGDHLQVEVRGGAVFYAPISEIVALEPRPRDVIADLCGEYGRTMRAA